MTLETGNSEIFKSRWANFWFGGRTLVPTLCIEFRYLPSKKQLWHCVEYHRRNIFHNAASHLHVIPTEVALIFTVRKDLSTDELTRLREFLQTLGFTSMPHNCQSFFFVQCLI